MLRIRLQRIGRKKRPSYRIVVAEHSTAATKNRYVESLGFYNPIASEKVFNVDKDKLLEWIKKGAKPTNTLARLLKGDGLKGMEPFIVEMKDRKKKKQVEKKPATPAPSDEETHADAPKEEEKPSEEEKPAEEAPEEEKPAEEKPVEEAPVEEAPAKVEKPAEEAPEEEKPVEEAPVEEAPAEEEKPAEEA